MKPIKTYLIPALLASTEAEAKKKIDFVHKRYPRSWIHIDVMDGAFVPNRCWCNPREYHSLQIANPQEIHLMVKNPEKHIEAWKKVGAQRIVFHYEATKKPIALIAAIHKLTMEAYIAINPLTPIEKLRLLGLRVDGILIMGVHPGFAGQKFIPYVIQKIKKSRRLFKTIPITVDGGVTLQNAKFLLKSGATRLVSTSAVYGKRIK